MDRIILEGSGKYHYSNRPTYPANAIPSVFEHWNKQPEIAPYPIIRPSCYYDSHCRYSGEEMRQIVELSRSYMQGYCANQGDFDLDEARLLRSTEHVSVLLLNLGDIIIVCRTSTVSSDCPRSSPTRISTMFCRTFCSGTRRVLRSFSRRMAWNDTLTDGESHPIAFVCSTDGMTSRLELIRRIELEGERLNWLAHAATFRVIWGKVEESTHGGMTTDRGVRKNLRQALEEGEDPADHMEAIVCPDVLGVAQGATSFLHADPVDAEALFHESPIFRTGSLNDCKRKHMPELRVCAFHLNSHAFAAGITAGKNALTKILITAVADQADVIVCDANMFANRSFPSDRRSDPATGAVLTILDRILVSAIRRRESSKRITYNWEVSTLATELLAALEGQDADCDCLLQIVLNYGKDMHTL